MHTNIIMAIYDEDLKRYDNVQYLIAERMESFFQNLCDSYEEQVERVERDSEKTQKVKAAFSHAAHFISADGVVYAATEIPCNESYKGQTLFVINIHC